MEQIYITNLEIQKVRHLQNIPVPLAETEMKHLIFTGKNGSGKTSVIEALANYLNHVFTDQYFGDKERWFIINKREKERAIQSGKSEGEIIRKQKKRMGLKHGLRNWSGF